MKTNQHMTVTMLGDTIRAEHKTMFVSLTDVFRIGNRLRVQEGKSLVLLPNYLRSVDTQEYIAEAAKYYNMNPNDMVNVTGKGNQRHTTCHLIVAIHAAQYLSTTFHVRVNAEFVNGRLFEYRDSSGDNFVALNAMVDTLPDRVGRNNTGIYIQMAKRIRAKLLEEGQTWNTATAEQLRKRSELEAYVFSIIDSGLVTEYQQLWTAIEKYRI